VSASGTKTWAVLYRRRSDGSKRRLTIGAFPGFNLNDARTEAKDILARAARGEDPAQKVQLRHTASSFNELSREWEIRYAIPNKSKQALYDDRLMLKKDILPAIGRAGKNKFRCQRAPPLVAFIGDASSESFAPSAVR